MTFRNYLGIAGALLIIAGGFSPMLRIPILGNWNYWDLDLVLASLMYCFAVLALLASIQNKPGLLRFSGWASLILLIFTLVAVHFKVNDYFNFIPMKKLAAAASRMVKYQWLGWILIAVGSMSMLIGGRKRIGKTSFRDDQINSQTKL